MTHFSLKKLFLQIFLICFNYQIASNATSISYENKENVALKPFGSMEFDLKRVTRDKEKTLIDELLKEAESIFGDCKTGKEFTKPINKIKNPPDSKITCTDPSPSIMLANLVKLQYIFKDLGGLLDIREVQDAFKKYINPYVQLTNDPLVFGSRECVNNEQNMTQINELSICPWHATIQIRENRYPMMVSHAKCNCKSCLHMSKDLNRIDTTFMCTPVYRLTPALMREEHCDQSTGVYEWKPILERIAFSCVCSGSRKVLIASG